MNEGDAGLVIFGIITITSAAIWHSFVTDYILAVLGATVSSVIVFQVVAFIYAGFLDPFFIIAMITTGIVSFIIALVIGAVMKWLKRHDKLKEAPQSGKGR
jgi:hypothetical protein